MMKKYILVLLVAASFCLTALSQADGNYRIDSISDGFWRIQAVKGTLSTCYLVEGSKTALLADACTGQEGLREIVTRLIGDKPCKLVLTHGHYDHSGGMVFFPEVYVHPADTGLLPKDARTARFYMKEGDVFDLGDKRLEVITIPGHTPGSVVFFNRSERYVFTGDGIGSTLVWAHISTDPLTVYLSSVKKLEAMKDAVDALYVGHHEQETVKLTPQYITDMRIVTELVLEGSIESTPYQLGAPNGRQASYGSATLVFNPDNLR